MLKIGHWYLGISESWVQFQILLFLPTLTRRPPPYTVTHSMLHCILCTRNIIMFPITRSVFDRFENFILLWKHSQSVYATIAESNEGIWGNQGISSIVIPTHNVMHTWSGFYLRNFYVVSKSFCLCRILLTDGDDDHILWWSMIIILGMLFYDISHILIN